MSYHDAERRIEGRRSRCLNFQKPYRRVGKELFEAPLISRPSQMPCWEVSSIVFDSASPTNALMLTPLFLASIEMRL
jgi:hypothetical protein